MSPWDLPIGGPARRGLLCASCVGEISALQGCDAIGVTRCRWASHDEVGPLRMRSIIMARSIYSQPRAGFKEASNARHQLSGLHQQVLSECA